MPVRTNTTDPATFAAAEALAALGVGDTALARQKYGEAGAILERDMKARKGGSDKQLLRFLAATQYYKGGHYQKAQELGAKIEARVLPENVRDLLPQFLKDVKERSSPGYVSGVQNALLQQQQEKRPRDVLRTLQDHPFVLKPGAMAFLRTVACEETGDFQAAALFFRTAIGYSPSDLDLWFATSAYPLHLATHGRADIARQYVQHQVELLPHPIPFVTAALVAIHQAMSRPTGERRPYFEYQVQNIERAWDSFQQLPSETRTHQRLRDYIGFGFEGAALAWRQLGVEDREKEATDRAVQLRPEAPSSWVTRGIATYPSEVAIADFKKAVELKEPTYTPYYFLAHDALQRGDFRSASSWCQQALTRNPSRRIEADLYGWLAVCRDSLGANRDEVDALFRKAQERDPEHEDVAANYRTFKESQTKRVSTTAPRWTPRPIQREDELPFPNFAAYLPMPKGREETVRERLLIGEN